MFSLDEILETILSVPSWYYRYNSWRAEISYLRARTFLAVSSKWDFELWFPNPMPDPQGTWAMAPGWWQPQMMEWQQGWQPRWALKAPSLCPGLQRHWPIQKIPFWIWWYQVKKATLLWGTLKEKFLPSSSILIISIKAHETMPLLYVRHSWMHKLWIFWPPLGHTHFSHCQAQMLLCWAFQRDLPAGYKTCEFGRSSSSSFS